MKKKSTRIELCTCVFLAILSSYDQTMGHANYLRNNEYNLLLSIICCTLEFFVFTWIYTYIYHHICIPFLAWLGKLMLGTEIIENNPQVYFLKEGASIKTIYPKPTIMDAQE